MAQKSDSASPHRSPPQWSSRLLMALSALGALLVVAACILMIGFALEANGIPLG